MVELTPLHYGLIAGGCLVFIIICIVGYNSTKQYREMASSIGSKAISNALANSGI